MVARNKLSSLFLSEGRCSTPPCLFLAFESADSYFLLCFFVLLKKMKISRGMIQVPSLLGLHGTPRS